MKRFNKTTLVMFITIILLGMAACSSNESSGNNDTGESNSNGNSSNGDTYTITMAHVASEAIGLHQAFLKFKEEVEEQSEGRLKVEIYPNAQLGGEREILEGVQNGDITATITSTGVGANFVPEVAVFDIPYLFTSKDHARHVFRTDGPLFEKIAPYYEEKGFKLMSFTDQGFRILTTNEWRLDDVYSKKQIINDIHEVMPLEPIEPNYVGEVATRYRYVDSEDEIGVISSVTDAFCKSCNRARISAEGKLYTCLFSSSGYDLREVVRSALSDEEVTKHIESIWEGRKDQYSVDRSHLKHKRKKIEMSHIGG